MVTYKKSESPRICARVGLLQQLQASCLNVCQSGSSWMRGKRAYLSTWSLALTTRNRPHHPNANPSRSNHRACSGDDVRIDSSPRPHRKTYLLLASIDNMLISLVRCRRCSGLDGVSTANEISADVRPGVNETDMSPSRPRCTGVW